MRPTPWRNACHRERERAVGGATGEGVYISVNDTVTRSAGAKEEAHTVVESGPPVVRPRLSRWCCTREAPGSDLDCAKVLARTTERWEDILVRYMRALELKDAPLDRKDCMVGILVRCGVENAQQPLSVSYKNFHTRAPPPIFGTLVAGRCAPKVAQKPKTSFHAQYWLIPGYIASCLIAFFNIQPFIGDLF